MNFTTRRTVHAGGLVLTALAALALATAAHAGGPPVSIQLNIGAPPPVYAPAPGYPQMVAAPAPPMVWLPQLGAYVALGIQQQIFYLGGAYYYFDRGGWYSGRDYGGPWRRLDRPPGQLRHFDGRDWGRYQDEARSHANEEHWRQFRPAPQQRWNGTEHRQFPGRGDEQRHPNEGRGRGDGHDHGGGHDHGDGHDGRGDPMHGGDR